MWYLERFPPIWRSDNGCGAEVKLDYYVYDHFCENAGASFCDRQNSCAVATRVANLKGGHPHESWECFVFDLGLVQKKRGDWVWVLIDLLFFFLASAHSVWKTLGSALEKLERFLLQQKMQGHQCFVLGSQLCHKCIADSGMQSVAGTPKILSFDESTFFFGSLGPLKKGFMLWFRSLWAKTNWFGLSFYMVF